MMFHGQKQLKTCSAPFFEAPPAISSRRLGYFKPERRPEYEFLASRYTTYCC